MTGLTELKGQWNEISFGDQAVMTQTLQAAASNIHKFLNAGSDPVGAVQGALNMVAQFAALAGPTGQIAAVALSFVSGCLSLFGASLRSCPLPIIPLCLSREESMIHFFVGSRVKKPESGLFSDWKGNNTDDLRRSDWPKCRHPLVVVDFSLHFCSRNEQ